jgi:oxygen-independent coproporphyrinogen-3 oxidase
MTYWHLNSYVGVGPGATGTLVRGNSGVRVTNTKDIESWLTDPRAKRETETITPEDLMIETLLMGMRLVSGISKSDFLHRFGSDISAFIPKTINSWTEKGLLENDSKRIALTKEGLLFLNRFLSDCMNELS